MLVPLNWLEDYLEIDVTPEKYAHELTMSGSKVEKIETLNEDITNVVVGKILSIEKHNNADKLQVTKVDVGNDVIQIVTGADNIKVNDYIPVALVGANLPNDLKIKKGKLRGVESNGMMCSIGELNLTKNDYPNAYEDGIFILNDILGEESIGKCAKEKLGLNDKIVEFEITSNRPDCLSILGIARESAVTLGKEFKNNIIEYSEDKSDNIKNYIDVEVKDKELCPRYAAKVVKNIKIEPSPDWMRRRLRDAGVRPINNIVDITNYVMLEYGQPMHAFDLNYLNSNKIIVRRGMKDEKIVTLDDQERTLDESMLVIADGNKSVALAGVMGCANSEITDDTKVIVFESANFEGVSVRATSKKMGLRTESSSRFEKGLDPNNTIYALDRAVQLIEQLKCGIIVSGIIDEDNSNIKTRKISYNPERINKILGSEISQKVMTEILTKLEFDVDEEKMEIIVPSFRNDVLLLEDVVEEVARFYGYNKIKATLLEGKHMTIGKRSESQIIKKSIKDNLLAMGYSELFTYSFTGTKAFDKICLSSDDNRREALKISNPLGEDYSIMRTTMIPEMLEVLSRNFNHRIESVKMFELSNIYIPTEKGNLPNEIPNLLIGMYGDGDFFNIKGIVEVLFEKLGILNYDFKVEENDRTFHPGRTANILIDGKKVGIMGEVHPNVLDNYEIGDKVYIAQLDILDLINNTNTVIQCKNLPKYPAMDRDIAVIIDDKIMVKEIESIIVKCSGHLLEEYKLFDLYKGNQIEEGKKSVAYSVRFRNYERTLKDKEVNKIMNKIINKLQNDLNAKLR